MTPAHRFQMMTELVPSSSTVEAMAVADAVENEELDQLPSLEEMQAANEAFDLARAAEREEAALNPRSALTHYTPYTPASRKEELRLRWEDLRLRVMFQHPPDPNLLILEADAADAYNVVVEAERRAQWDRENGTLTLTQEEEAERRARWDGENETLALALTLTLRHAYNVVEEAKGEAKDESTPRENIRALMALVDAAGEGMKKGEVLSEGCWLDMCNTLKILYTQAPGVRV